jgi:iron complex outermembrane receptor protein
MKSSSGILRALAGAALLVRIGSTAFAQVAQDAQTVQGGGGGDRLEEIIVTAQKREQSLQTVGTSITALDATALSRLGLTDVTSVASQTPGMQFNQYSPTITIYNLRGISQNDFSDHQEAPIAVYSDDVYVASMSALAGAMYDLARVEILRGPQGTLFGRNATGGLIQYISEKPKFDDEGNFSVTGGNYSTVNSEGFLNTALNDRFAVRLSFATDYHEGYVENRIGPDLGNQNQYAARLQFLYKPNDAAEVLLNFYGVNDDHETGAAYSWEAAHPDATGRAVAIGPTSTANCPDIFGGCTPGGDLSGYRNASTSPFSQADGRPGLFNRTIGGATLHVTWNFDEFSLTSVTDYMRLQKRYEENSGINPLPNYFEYDDGQDYHQLSQELRLNGNVDSLKWITGLYFLDLSTHDNELATVLPALGGDSGADYSLSTRSEAAFAQAEYDFTSATTGIAGVRYSNDQKTFDYLYFNAPQAPFVYDPSTDPTAQRTFANITGKAELDYKFDQDSMLYGSWNRGAKGGGWSAPISGVIDPADLPYRQEVLTSYEIGEKLTFLDGRARLNSAIFYYDYKNYQGFFVEGLTNVVQNVQAREKGGEMEFAWAPVRGANLQLSVSHLETAATSVPLPAGGYTETEMPQAPKWSVNGAASYDWVVPAGRVSFELDAKWNGKQHLELENAPADLEPAYIVANTRISYTTPDDRCEIAGWVRNFTDRWYRVYALDLSSLGFMQNVYGPPRTFGATFTYRWSP